MRKSERQTVSLARVSLATQRITRSIHLLAVKRTMASSSSNVVKKSFSPRLKLLPESVWVLFNDIARQYAPVVNLGQGFPDFAAPQHVRQALAEAANGAEHTAINQYTREFGHLRLVRALAALFGRVTGLQLNAETQVLVANGASQVLFEAFLALVADGDEVILIEPAFDCYEPMVRMAGGTPVFVPLRPKQEDPDNSGSGFLSSAEWTLDKAQLEAAFNPKTKLIVLNTPHNPIGKVFSRDELVAIGELCKRHDVIVVMDEVYEWLAYSGSTHVRMATLPGMFDRTLTVGSAGKTFSITGWKIGWAYGPEYLMSQLFKLHQTVIYSCNSPAQEAIAVAFEAELARLDTPTSYWHSLVTSLEPKRDRLARLLTSIHLRPTLPDGGYFLVADCRQLASQVDLSSESGTTDYRLAKWLAKKHKLLSIPLTAFYSEAHKGIGEHYLRFCFIKRDETLDEASAIIDALAQKLNALSPSMEGRNKREEGGLLAYESGVPRISHN